ncbi:MAG TPA: glutamate--tRNA ligase [Geminicoccaceae bacterium]
MTTTVRFAPSPTGRLHVGNARTALINWLFARSRSGWVLLRIDDTDLARSDPTLIPVIDADLRWLGLDWDLVARQSERLDDYDQAFERLRAAGRVYACYETSEELDAARRQARAAGRPPLYDRTGLRLGAAERARLEAEGRRPHWRFALPDDPVRFADLIQGEKRFSAGALSDPVVRRADGSPTFLFASAVDDAAFGITHVVRGEDHVTNTAVQIRLMQGLDAAVPAFAHLPLLLDAAGAPLSKRLGSLDLGALQAEGVEPLALASYLAALGTALAPRTIVALGDLLGDFRLEAYGRASPRFDPGALERHSVETLRALPYATVRPRLVASGLTEAGEDFWLAVRPNLGRFAEVAHWWAVCRAALVPVVEDPDYLEQAASLLPDRDLDRPAAEAWIDRLKHATGRKGRALYRPLRLALTGREHGPALGHLLPILGRERVLARLRGQTA